MKRRELLKQSASAITAACLLPAVHSVTSFSGVGVPRAFAANTDTTYETGEELRFFDSTGNHYVIWPTDHKITQFDETNTASWSFGGLDNDTDSLNFPTALVADSDGSGYIHVVDRANGRIVVIDSQGRKSFEYGSLVSNGFIQDIAVGHDGNFYFTTASHDVKIVSPAGVIINTFGQDESGNNILNFPRGIAILATGDIVVADSGNARLVIFDPNGEVLMTVGSYGREEGFFLSPRALAVDNQDRIYVADPLQLRVSVFTSSGELLHSFTPLLNDGTPGAPISFCWKPDNTLYIAAHPQHIASASPPSAPPSSPPPGLPILPADIDGDLAADSDDSFAGLKILTGQKPHIPIRSNFGTSGADVGGNERIGLEEVIKSLQ